MMSWLGEQSSSALGFPGVPESLYASEGAILQELYRRTYLAHAPLMLPGPGLFPLGDIFRSFAAIHFIRTTDSS